VIIGQPKAETSNTTEPAAPSVPHCIKRGAMGKHVVHEWVSAHFEQASRRAARASVSTRHIRHLGPIPHCVSRPKSLYDRTVAVASPSPTPNPDANSAVRPTTRMVSPTRSSPTPPRACGVPWASAAMTFDPMLDGFGAHTHQLRTVCVPETRPGFPGTAFGPI
jgi:hypothetical protein